MHRRCRGSGPNSALTRKKGVDTARDDAEKYKQREYKDFAAAVDNIFGNALGTLCTNGDYSKVEGE